MLMGKSERLVVLGTIPFLWWIVAVAWSQQSTARTGAASLRAWVIGGALVWAVALLFLHKFEVLGEHGVFGPTTVAAVGVVVGLGELVRRVPGNRTSRVPPEGLWNALAAGVAILLLLTNRAVISRSATPQHFAERVEVPGISLPNDYLDVGRWCRANTQVDAVFLVPPWLNGFRVFSQRGIVGDWKDGAQVYYTREYAMAWSQRMADLNGYDSFDEARLTEVGSKYGATFALTRRSHRLALPVAYENNSFIVYSLSSGGATSGKNGPSVPRHSEPRPRGLPS